MAQNLEPIIQSIKEKLGKTPESAPRDDSRSEETTTAGTNSDNTNNVEGKTDVEKRIVSPEEFAAAAGHSGKFNIVVEGETDVEVYEQLIALIGIENIGCYYAGNREELFKIYRKVKDTNADLLKKVAFIADQDSWVFLCEKPPPGYEDIKIEDIIWTEGYSIENDLYIKGNLRNLVKKDHLDNYEKTLHSICTWYAFEVSKWNHEGSLPVKSLRNMVPYGEVDLAEELIEKIKSSVLCKTTLKKKTEDIKQKYTTLIQGKTLFALLSDFLGQSGYPIKIGGDQSFDFLARIAIIFSQDWSSYFEQELENRFPGLAKPSSSTTISKILAKRGFEGAVNTIKELIDEHKEKIKETENTLKQLEQMLDEASRPKA